MCRERELQVILTTHSPYILEELPLEARAYILPTEGGREIIYGVSPEFLTAHAPELVQRCRITPFGASSVGKSLGMMVSQNRFYNPTCVFLDGDEGTAPGCMNLPGEDPPERVVFEALNARNWLSAATRTGRDFADFADACKRAMTLHDHHEWVRIAATHLTLSGDTLWQALCAEWATKCLTTEEAKTVVQTVQDAVDRVPQAAAVRGPPPLPAAPPLPISPARCSASNSTACNCAPAARSFNLPP